MIALRLPHHSLAGDKTVSRTSLASARWVVSALALAAAIWFAGFVALVKVACLVHVDIPTGLTMKLPLLQLRPELIFAGESRTYYAVDPMVAAQHLGKPRGYAVNIAYDAGEPLAFLAAIREQPEVFRSAHLVISVAPFTFNEGVRSASVYPLDVAARLGVSGQFASFFPLRIGTTIRFISEAFAARAQLQQFRAVSGPIYDELGVGRIKAAGAQDKSKTPLSSHPYYANWNLSGPKAQYETAALCEMVPLVKKLTVLVPPWSVIYDRNSDDLWRVREGDVVRLLTEAGSRCNFDVLNIPEVPGLAASDFADEMHVNVAGTPAYTRYLVDHLKP